MTSAGELELNACDVLSAYRSIERLISGVACLTRSGFARNELCLLVAEPAAAVELGISRFGCLARDPDVHEPPEPDSKVSDLLGPLIVVESEQAPPGEALIISQGALCTRMQAHALVTGGAADIGTVMGYCLGGEDLAWALSRLSQGSFLLSIHAPTAGAQARAVDLLRAAGAEEIRTIDQPPHSDQVEKAVTEA